jgi:hypothetical protein
MLGILEQQRRPLRLQHTIADFCHFQVRGNRRVYAFEFARTFKLINEVS